MSYYLSGLLAAKQIRNPPVDYEVGKEVLPHVEPENICEKVYEIMESVPRVPQEELIQEFVYLDVTHTPQILAEVVDIIIDKSIKEPNNAHKCVEIVRAKVNHDTRNGNGKFHTAILRRNQKVFYDEINREHRFGITNLMGHLYVMDLASAKIIKRCVVTLLETLLEDVDDQDMDLDAIYHGFHLLKVTGKTLDDDPSPALINGWIERFIKVSPRCSPRVRSMIHGFMEIRARSWVQG